MRLLPTLHCTSLGGTLPKRARTRWNRWGPSKWRSLPQKKNIVWQLLRRIQGEEDLHYTPNDPPNAYHRVERIEPGKEICRADVHSWTNSCTKHLFLAIKEIKTYMYTGESRDNSCRYPAWYIARRLACMYHSRNWEKFTQDWWVLKTVRGYEREFTATPHQVRKPRPPYYSAKQLNLTNKEDRDLLRKVAVSWLPEEQFETGFYLNLFLVPKKGGGQMPVINLHVQSLNMFVVPACPFPDGRDPHLERSNKAQILADKGGPEVCLFYDPHPQHIKKAPQVCGGRDHLPIQLSPVRPIVSTVGLYQDLKASSGTPTGIRGPSYRIHRRHAC